MDKLRTVYRVMEQVDRVILGKKQKFAKLC